ncbi:RES family NAD+ phosphorylase [Aestuariibius sp. 2305UL40-4]|uniref:RES family NAD+ phosphorylase n=1 Tax=Aestuariibius violaceus TaxID=3234132 RepID=UPI00345E7A51
MDATELALVEIGGLFVRIERDGAQGMALRKGLPQRPPARFNRLGEDALYLSPDAESASVAIGGNVVEGETSRLLIRYHVETCKVVDLRQEKSADLYELARQPWRTPLERGEDPPSWTAADIVRASGAVGLIDPSRRRPGLWHVTLFRWNAPGAPTVRVDGPPEPIVVQPDYR